MAKIDETIEAIQARLKQAKARKQKMEAATKAAEAKALRSSLTQRKILLGAFLLDLMNKNPDYGRQVLKGLEGFLTRDRDRKIFGFEPLPPSPGATAPDQATPDSAPPPQTAPSSAPAAAPAPARSRSPAPEPAPLVSDVDMPLIKATDESEMKRIGAKFKDGAWYVPAGVDARPFMKWF